MDSARANGRVGRGRNAVTNSTANKIRSVTITVSLATVVAVLVLAIRIGAQVQWIQDQIEQTQMQTQTMRVSINARMDKFEENAGKQQESLDEVKQYLKDIHQKLNVPEPPDPPAQMSHIECAPDGSLPAATLDLKLSPLK